jgi:hypothetical protein
MLKKIEQYATVKASPLKVSGRNANVERMQALANLGQKVGDMAFNIGAKKRQQQGLLEGSKAGTEAAESGASPTEQKGLFPTIYGDAFNNAQQGAYLASVDRKAVERLSELEEEFSNDVEGYTASAQGLLKGIIKNAPESYTPALNDSISNYVSRGTMRVNKNVIEQGKKEAKSELLGGIDTYSREASRAARNGDNDAVQDMLGKVKLAGQALVANRSWTKEQADEALRQARNETTEQSYLQIVDDMPINEAAKAIDDAEKDVFAGFSGDEHDILISRARARLQNRIVDQKRSSAVDKSVYRERQAAVEIAIKTGEGDPDKLMVELTELFNKKIYTPTQYAGHIATIHNDLRKTEKVWERIENKDASILVDPAAVDKVYRKDISGLDDGAKVQFATSVNRIPDELKKEITNFLYAGDIQQAAKAADMIKRMDDIQGLPEAFTSKDRAYALQIKDLMDVYSPEEAILRARKNTDPRDKARIESRQEELKTIYKHSSIEHSQTGVDKALGSFFGGGVDNMVKPEIAKAYKAAFEDNFTAGMERSQAEDAASEAIKRVYSDWEGRPMKHSPDKYYQIDGSSEWVKDDLIKELRANIAGSPEIKDFYFITDDRTEREAEMGAPSYLVKYRTDSGWDDLMGRYIPDIDSAKEKLQGDAGAEIESIRNKSKLDFDPTPSPWGS